MASDPQARVERLTQHRREVGQAKETAALKAVEDLLVHGHPITFTGVQRAASVSSWFVYNNAKVRAAIDAARSRTPLPTQRPTMERASAESLRADLAQSRAEVADLRQERDRLRSRLRRDLGAAMEQRDTETLVARVQELERARVALSSELHAARVELSQAQEEVAILTDDRDAARSALRRMMREQSAAASG